MTTYGRLQWESPLDLSGEGKLKSIDCRRLRSGHCEAKRVAKASCKEVEYMTTPPLIGETNTLE